MASRPIGRKTAILLGQGLNMLSVTPMRLVLDWGVILLARYVGSKIDEPLDRPPGSFPHDGGRWEDAVREVARTWGEIVHGREAG